MSNGLNKTTFTDKDIQNMKYQLEDISDVDIVHFLQDVQALLHRLECAELFIKKNFMPIEWEGHPDYKAWLKSKGGSR